MEPIQLGAMRWLKRLRPLVDGLSSTHVAARQPLVAAGRCAARVLACGCEGHGQQAASFWPIVFGSTGPVRAQTSPLVRCCVFA